MTPDQFRATLKRLGLRQRWLADRLGVCPTTVFRWAKGDLPVPQYAVFALSLIDSGQPEADTVERVARRLGSWLRPGLDARYVARAVLSVLAPDYHQLRRASKVMGDEDRE